MGGCDIHETVRPVDLSEGDDQFHGLLGTGAFLALAGIVFGITTRGTSAINEDRNGLVASGIAYLLCTPSSVSFLSGLAGG